MTNPAHFLISSLLLIPSALPAAGEAERGYYAKPPLFSTAPDTDKTVNTITRFGPVGMAVDLYQPDFTMKTGTIEPGSPAEAAGLAKGQVITSINGRTLKDTDPRIILGDIITEAEAKDGVVSFTIEGAPDPVVVKIPVLGSYRPKWPLDCPKSDKIVRNLAAYFAKPESNKGFADFGMLFLLSTGEEKDLAIVREWVHGLAGKKSSGYAWHIGYGGLAICEYYLRTGDEKALPVIRSWVDAAAKGEYLDGWAGRGGVTKLGYGNGHLNAGGTGVVTFLLLAKQCGVDVDESLLNRTLVHFFRYAGRGLNPYGDDRPETSFVDNGKNGKLAFAMAAAASLTPDGENSIYAKARDHMAMTSFYTTTFMLHGHTGGGIGEIWRSAAMGLLSDKKSAQYRDFMDHRRWHYELSRRFDGSFGIVGGAGYDKEEWGNCYAITYTVPRKTLRITGAPPSKFSKSYQLPTRPWGTENDDIFVSLDPVPGGDIDVSGETLTKDSAKPLITRLNEKELTDDEIRHYLHHPDYLIRNMVSLNAAGLSCDYMFPKPGHPVRPDLLREFCEHPDARVRNAGFRASLKAFDPAAAWCQGIFDLAVARLGDDSESWFVKDACLSVVAKGTPDMIVPHVDLILTYLKHPEQWLQNGALMALANVITDARVYQKVLPPVGELLQTTPRQSTTGGPIYAIRQQLPSASPEVRDLALKSLGGAYENYSGGDTWVGGQDLSGHRKETLGVLASALAEVPGGFDVLYQVSQKQFPNDPLPHDEIFLSANPENFGPDLKNAIIPLIREELIYQYIGHNRRSIFNDIRNPRQGGTVTNSLNALVSLYNKIGVHDYDWKPFGPDLKNADWNYHTFDPPEKQAYDKTPWRYREVTYPAGMENWFAPDFHPAKAGWKKGKFPIGQFDGKLGHIKSPFNQWEESPRTLWENEVLLVNGTFKLPPANPGHLYRLRVQTGQGVGAGDGFRVYLNGKPLVEDKLGLGRRQGDSIRGGWITQEFAAEFGKAPVTLAATSFLKYGDRAIVTMPPVPRGIFSMWLEEMKIPPLDETVLRKAAAYVPLLSSDWQALQNPENPPEDPEAGKFRFDGKFTANPEVTGTWTVVATVDKPADFDPAAKPNPGRSPFRQITIQPGGTTHDTRWIWSGSTLIDLDQNTAHKITSLSVDGSDTLFVEAGGFSPKNPPGWKSQLMVLKRTSQQSQ